MYCVFYYVVVNIFSDDFGKCLIVKVVKYFGGYFGNEECLCLCIG